MERRLILKRAELVFKRKVAGPGDELYFPINRTDICNKIWNVLKIIVRPDTIQLKNNIKKPGLYYIHVNLLQKPKVMLRIRVTNGSEYL